MADPALDREILKLYRKIEKTFTENDLSAMGQLLNTLKSKPITLDTLRSTQIGKKVNQLRTKVEDKEVKQQMRGLIKFWKTLNSESEGAPAQGAPGREARDLQNGITDQNSQNGSSKNGYQDDQAGQITNSISNTSVSTNHKMISQNSGVSQNISQKVVAQEQNDLPQPINTNQDRIPKDLNVQEHNRQASLLENFERKKSRLQNGGASLHLDNKRIDTSHIDLSETSASGQASSQTPSDYITPIDYCGDSNRDKARDLIGKALRSKFPNPMHTLCNRRAVQLEKGLDELYGNNLKKYKLQLMSKISNLKDDKNPDLRESLISGTITGVELAKLTPAQMASDELKAKNEQMKKENLLEHQVSVQMGTETDMFKCGKCKQRRCTYNQLQTRSSDEPMTTFVFCTNCGNRWKFC